MCHFRLLAEGDGYGKEQKQQGRNKVDGSGLSFRVTKSRQNFTNRTHKRFVRAVSGAAWLLLLAGTLFINSPQCFAARHNVYIEQTPPSGGTVAPGTGIFSIEEQDILKLRAVPKPGYRFLHWLGLDEMQDNTENETGARINSPMIIVAVFGREQNQRGGGTMLHPSPPLRMGGGSVGTIRDPDDPNGGPKPPEPATIALLGFGGILLRMGSKRRRA